MPKNVAAIGTDAVAEAMRQINPDVVPAYPITPQTAIVESFSQMVANNAVDTKLINVESEHSAMSAGIGAAAAGSRVMTCTSSQGLALMWEMLYIAAGLRLPIVMTNVNRALSAPINIHCDHSDSMGARDSGWIQLYCENAQEAYDNVIQAVRIAEHPDVLLPVMVNMDGFIISHSIDRVQYMNDEKTRDFIGELEPAYSLLDPENPLTVGSFAMHDSYFEFKRAQEQGMRNAPEVVRFIGETYGKFSGRKYGFFEEYMLDDAEIAILALGSATGTTKAVVNELREKGIPIGLLKLRMFRPFPAKDLLKSLSHLKAVAVFDRSDTCAGEMGGPLFVETRSAFYEADARPLLLNYIYGLGGRDLNQGLIQKAAGELNDAARNGEVKQTVNYLGLRE